LVFVSVILSRQMLGVCSEMMPLKVTDSVGRMVTNEELRLFDMGILHGHRVKLEKKSSSNLSATPLPLIAICKIFSLTPGFDALYLYSS
jgi:hypothetical protein